MLLLLIVFGVADGFVKHLFVFAVHAPLKEFIQVFLGNQDGFFVAVPVALSLGFNGHS